MSFGIYKIIKSSPLFHDLYEEEVDEFLKGCQVIQYKQDEYILEKDKDSQSLIVILNGQAQVKRGDGTLITLAKGELLGELILLNESKQQADVLAGIDTDVLSIEFNYIYSYFLKNPRIFSILMLNLARMLAARLKKAGDIIHQMKTQESL